MEIAIGRIAFLHVDPQPILEVERQRQHIVGVVERIRGEAGQPFRGEVHKPAHDAGTGLAGEPVSDAVDLDDQSVGAVGQGGLRVLEATAAGDLQDRVSAGSGNLEGNLLADRKSVV